MANAPEGYIYKAPSGKTYQKRNGVFVVIDSPKEETITPQETKETVLPDWLAEFAGGFNRSMARTGDFFTTSPINTVSGLLGSDFRVPTFEQGMEAATGGTHGFMEPGLGRDVVAAAGEWAPALAQMLMGRVPERALRTGNPNQLMDEAAPSIEQLRSRASAQYEKLRSIDDVIPQEVLDDFVGGLRQKLKDGGLAVDRKTSRARAPIAYSVFRDAADDFGSKADDVADDLIPEWLSPYADDVASKPRNVTLADIETVRQNAQDAVMSPNKPDVRFGNIIKNYIDEFMERYPSGAEAVKKARLLTQQQKKAERIEQMIALAENSYASGTENGLRLQARQLMRDIIKNKEQGWTADEIAAIRRVARGGPIENTLRLIGKAGVADSSGAMRGLIPGLATGGAAAVGNAVAGPVGGAVAATATPIVGQAARTASERMLMSNARLASAIVRAGPNARLIAAAYMKNVPPAMQSADELASLFFSNRVPIVQLARIGEATGFNPLVTGAATAAVNMQKMAESE